MPKKTTSDVNKPETGPPKKRILIVDDEFDLSSTFALLFQLNGFEAFTANNGRHALEVMAQGMPDIILSDYMMPVMDGVELSKRLRAHAATAHIPFVLMSAIPQHQNLIDSNASAFIQKPMRFKKLLETILQVMSSHEAGNTFS